PSLLIETAIEGVMLTAECDLMKVWPKLWPNRTAATRTLKAKTPTLPGFEPIEYQLVGPNMKKRIGYFNLSIIPERMAGGATSQAAGLSQWHKGGRDEAD